jgi:hypothetical protein
VSYTLPEKSHFPQTVCKTKTWGTWGQPLKFEFWLKSKKKILEMPMQNLKKRGEKP